MARVFLSYRRADGRYAVGWIAERLRRLDAVTGIETAFHDADLRCGDDFPAALAAQIDKCDVLIAVIGPEWHGREGERPARILDPDDWVGREITSAFDLDKPVLPILIDGAEPLVPEDLRPELAPLVDRHAVVFNDERDLEEFAADLESHLRQIDHERARRAGLTEPVRLAPFRPPASVVALVVVAAAIAAIARWQLNRVESVANSQHDALAVIHVGLGAAIAASLAAYAAIVLRPLARVQFVPVLAGLGVGGGVMLWMSAVYDDLLREGDAWWNILTLALSAPILVPAAYIVIGMGWLTMTMDTHELGHRTRFVGEHHRAVTVTAVAVALWSVLGVFTTEDIAERFFHVTAAGMGSIIIIASVVWARTRLERESLELGRDMADLAVEHRDNARRHLVTEPLTEDEWWLVVVMLLPLLAGVLRTVLFP